MNSVVNAVVGGWQASTIVSIHSGFPLAVYEATDTSEHRRTWTSSQLLASQMQSFGRQSSFQQRSFQGYQWMSPPDIR